MSQKMENKTKIPETVKEIAKFADIKINKASMFIPFLSERDYLGHLQSSTSQLSKDESVKVQKQSKSRKIKKSGSQTDRVRYPANKNDSVLETPVKQNIQIKEYPQNEKLDTINHDEDTENIEILDKNPEIQRTPVKQNSRRKHRKLTRSVMKSNSKSKESIRSVEKSKIQSKLQQGFVEMQLNKLFSQKYRVKNGKIYIPSPNLTFQNRKRHTLKHLGTSTNGSYIAEMTSLEEISNKLPILTSGKPMLVRGSRTHSKSKIRSW